MTILLIFPSDCSTNKDVALSVELIALTVSLTAAVGVGLLFIVVIACKCVEHALSRCLNVVVE